MQHRRRSMQSRPSMAMKERAKRSVVEELRHRLKRAQDGLPANPLTTQHFRHLLAIIEGKGMIIALPLDNRLARNFESRHYLYHNTQVLQEHQSWGLNIILVYA